MAIGGHAENPNNMRSFEMTILMGKEQIEAREALIGGQPYTLTVLNQNSKLQQFALFQTLPNIVGPSVSPTSLAWMLGGAAPGSIGNPSQSQFYWEINYQANTGYIQDQGTITNPRRFATAANVNVQITSQNATGVTYMGTFPYGAPALSTPKDGKSGLICVQADGTIPTALQQQSNAVSVNVGIAMNNRPTVAVQLLPGILYQFTPKPTYYIIAGSFVQGQVIDTATSTQAFEVKFEGVTDRTIVFTEKNQFEEN